MMLINYSDIDHRHFILDIQINMGSCTVNVIQMYQSFVKQMFIHVDSKMNINIRRMQTVTS